MSDVLEFGIKRENEERRDGGCAVVFDPASQKYAVGKQENGWLRLFSGGINNGEDIKDGTLRELLEESGLHDYLYIEKVAEALAHYHNGLKNIDRVAHATCFLVILKSTDLKSTQLEEHEKFVLEWTETKELLNNWESRNQEKNYDHWIYFFKKAVNRAIELGYDKTSAIIKE